jgi:uncharacterized protein YjaG (DUF416 family)
MLNYDNSELERALAELPQWKRTAFIVGLAARLLPHYRRFSSAAGFGNVSLLEGALIRACHFVETGDSLGELQLLRAECEEQTPDTTLFSHPLTSAALDAALVVILAVEEMAAPNARHAFRAAMLARDTVDLFVLGLEEVDINNLSPSPEAIVLRHRLMQCELQRQRESIAILRRGDLAREAVAHELRSRLRSIEGSLD